MQEIKTYVWTSGYVSDVIYSCTGHSKDFIKLKLFPVLDIKGRDRSMLEHALTYIVLFHKIQKKLSHSDVNQD